jgi:hypothetical protein
MVDGANFHPDAAVALAARQELRGLFVDTTMSYTRFQMTNIVPSQIVDYIDVSFDKNWFQRGGLELGAEGAVGIVAGLLDLVDRVPSHLITLPREDAAQLFANLAALRVGVQRAQNLSLQERQLTGVPPLKPVNQRAGDPVTVVRTCLRNAVMRCLIIKLRTCRLLTTRNCELHYAVISTKQIGH